MCNRRVPTEFHNLIEGDIPDNKVEDKVSSQVTTYRRQERDPDNGTSSTVTSTERKNRRTYALSSRAAEFGSKVMHDYRRIMGMLESGHKNRKWVIAVCRWILTRLDLQVTRSKWVDAIRANKHLPPDQAKKIVARILTTMTLWASQADEITEFEPSLETKTEPTSGQIDIDVSFANDRDVGTLFVQTLSASPVAAALQSRGVCPYCIYAEIAEVADYVAPPPPIDPQSAPWQMEDEMFSEYLRTLNTKTSSNSWAEACARAHNREMHAANGNIDHVTNYPNREGAVALGQKQVWDAPTIQAYDGPEVAVLVYKSIEGIIPEGVLYF